MTETSTDRCLIAAFSRDSGINEYILMALLILYVANVEVKVYLIKMYTWKSSTVFSFLCNLS